MSLIEYITKILGINICDNFFNESTIENKKNVTKLDAMKSVLAP